MTTTLGVREPLTPAALDLLDRSQGDLVTALRSEQAGERYVHAHLAALRAAAAVVAVRGRPVEPGGDDAGNLAAARSTSDPTGSISPPSDATPS